LGLESIQESLGSTRPQLPRRSTLFHLEPIGIGTPYVESLSGYISRLAKEHFISTSHLMSKLVAPRIGKPHTINDRGNFKLFAKAMNALGVTALDLVEVFETLTLRNDLQFTTMLPWAGVLPSRWLIKPIRAWCPECYEERRINNQEIYEPIIWAISSITTCLRHHRCLDNTCPDCGHQLYHLSPRSYPGHCSRCMRWLGKTSDSRSSSPGVLTGDKLERQVWDHENVGEIIALSPKLSGLQAKANFAEGLAKQINTLAHGRINDFSLLLPVDSCTVRQWLKGKQLPTLDMLLQVGFRLNKRLVKLLCLDLAHENSAKIESSPHVRLGSSTISERPTTWEEVEKRLRATLEEFPPPGLRKVAQRIGYCSRETLKKRFPKICATLSAKYLVYHRKPLDIKKAQKLIQTALVESPPPSLQQVYNRLGGHGTPTSLRKHFPDECPRIVMRYAEYKRRPIDKNIIERTLEAALNDKVPQSLKGIASKLRISRWEIMKALPNLSKAISARYITYRKELSHKKHENTL
jgi:TniQ